MNVALFGGFSKTPLAPGWTRDYFVYFNGYVKDMDFYAAHAQTVGPLPFKGMSNYPYGPEEAFPEGEAQKRWRGEYHEHPAHP